MASSPSVGWIFTLWRFAHGGYITTMRQFIRRLRSIASVPSYWISATSRSNRACAPTFRFLEKMLRPSPPTLRDAGNAEQSLDLSSISSVNSKYVSNRQIVCRSFDDPDLISSADRAFNDDAQVCPGSQRFGKTAHKSLIVHPNSKPPARNPRFGHFKHSGADPPTLANERVVHRDSLRRKIFSKLAILKRSAESCSLPGWIA